MVANHTPGPYVTESGQARGAWIEGSDGNWIALVLGETDDVALANKAFILKALGSHEQLVAALDYVLKHTYYDANGYALFKPGYDPQHVIDALVAARMAYGD